jgi:tripartite-type tricarboxylate transporter receptor subunit TctC
MTRHLRHLATAALLIGALCAGQGAIAKDWPTQPVRIVLPYPPGGASDVTARLLGQKMGQAWDTSVVIENRPGANGIIANEAAAKSPADGYTILMANLGPNAINPAVYAKLPYDTVKDFAPVILTTIVPLVIVTAADSPIKSLAQLIAMAKEKPGLLTFGSAGIRGGQPSRGRTARRDDRREVASRALQGRRARNRRRDGRPDHHCAAHGAGRCARMSRAANCVRWPSLAKADRIAA